jgi:hypothetical protein
MANKEDKMTFVNDRMTDRDNVVKTNYDNDCDRAKTARNTQRHDTDPMIEKEGFLGVDDLDRLRRRKIGKLF